MSKSKSAAGEQALEYCQRYKHFGSLQVAKALKKDFPRLYHDVEHARGFVRYYRGESGKAHRARAKAKKEVVIPESDAAPLKPYRLPVRHGFGAVMSDIHVPYHDKRAVEVAIAHCQQVGATDFLVIDGDLLDAYQLSRWNKDPRKRNFPGELEMANALLDALQGVFDLIVFKLGNHEVRFYNYIFMHAPELLGLPGTSWDEMLRLKERGIPLVEAEQEIGVAYSGGRQNLTIVHGHEFYQGGFAPVNAARGLFLRAKCCAIQGHLHQTSTHAEGRLDGTPITTWGLGCLCDLRPQYAPMAFTKWNHGFATLGLQGREFRVDNLRIIEGGIY